MKLLQLLEENKNNDVFICREGFEGYTHYVSRKNDCIYLTDANTGEYLVTRSGCRVMWNPLKKDLLSDDWIVHKYGRPKGETDYTTPEGYVVTTEQYSLIKTQKAINDTLNKLLDRMSEGVVHTNQGEWHTARTVSSSPKEMTTAIKLDTTQAQESLDMLSDTLSKVKEEYKELQEYKEYSTKLVPKPKEKGTGRLCRLAEAYALLKDKGNDYTKMIDVWNLTEWELATDGETLISQNDEGATAWLPTRHDLLKSTKYRVK